MAIEKNIKINVDAKDAIKDVKSLDKGVKDTSTSASASKSAFSKMTGGVKGLGVAFKALGIGLIVAALMKLKDIFSGNIETARQFEVITSQLSAAFDVIRDRSEQFIKSLLKLKNPLQAFKEAFTGTTAEIKEETKAMAALQKKLQEVRDEEMEMVVVRAEANKIIAESRLLAEDETKTLEARLVALKAAITEEQRVAQIELDTQQKKVDALQAVIDLGKSSEEDLVNLQNERAKLIDLQTSSTQRQLRVTRELNTMERELLAENKKRGEQEKAITIDAITNEDMLLKAKQDGLELQKSMSEDEIKLLEETEDRKREILAARIEASKAMQVDGARSILNSVGQLAGEGTKMAKAAGLAGILIDTAKGISGAVAAGAGIPFPANLGAILSGVGVVLANIATAKQMFKKVKGGGGGSPDAPSAPAPVSGATGMGALDIPNIEGIEQPELGGGQPTVQAFVVENDISNAQALQEELDVQATL